MASTWLSGARSVAPLNADGYFSYSVPAGAVAIVVGLNYTDTSPDPAEIEYGLYVSGGQINVVENGVNRTAPQAYTGQTCHLVRSGSTVYYCLGTTPSDAPGARFPMPGTVIYTSTIPSDGTVYLDASMMSQGDEVRGATLTNITTGGAVYANMQPLQAYASTDGAAQVNARFQPMTARAELVAAVVARMEPLQVYVSASGEARVSTRFEAMTAQAYAGTAWDGVGVDTVMQPMQAYAAAAGADNSAVVRSSFEPMQTFASSGTWTGVAVTMLPMTVRAQSADAAALPAFNVRMPAFGNSPAFPDLTDTVLVGDTLTGDAWTMMQEVATVADAAIASGVYSEVLTDSVAMSEQQTLGETLLAVETIAVNDTVWPSAGSAVVTDIAQVDDLVVTRGVSSMALVDTIAASDAAWPVFELVLEDVVVCTDSLVVSAVLLLTDVVAVGDDFTASAVGAATAADLVKEVVTVADETFITAVTRALLTDTVLVDDALFNRDPSMIAWVMNSDSGGVSWYDNWSFTDMAMVDGKLLAIGPEGLVLVAGDLDAGDQIKASVNFGFTDFSGYTPEGMPVNTGFDKKHVSDFWVGYHSSGVLRATVETYGQGCPPYTYTMVQRDADQPRNGRIRPGKGLNARFWRIGFENTDGCAFHVNSIAADLVSSKRKL